MLSLRTLSPALLGLALLAQPAAAQTTPTTHLPTHRVKRMPAAKPAPRTVPNTSPAARAADPLRGTNDNGKGDNGYAAPGEPVNVTDNGKNTPSYDGPAPKPASRTKTTLATPK
ncbi:hypothetical protein GKZ68_16640 [Hymenobacter sp. BRD128]|uniref:hypothetical protein n=1 Tax=Hymenobacter sp. BRD128 TaxID=2675878 RepID=UPI001566F3DB|nr:hypothetical protein [Hymenobacter sp. BRD128]QKG58107.1 hypothetical protein GKZ68_16640 [Hymenobacter sp. BRD128]